MKVKIWQKPQNFMEIWPKTVLFRGIARIFTLEKPCYLENRVVREPCKQRSACIWTPDLLVWRILFCGGFFIVLVIFFKEADCTTATTAFIAALLKRSAKIFCCKTINFMGCLPLAVTTHFCLSRGSQTTCDYSAN